MSEREERDNTSIDSKMTLLWFNLLFLPRLILFEQRGGTKKLDLSAKQGLFSILNRGGFFSFAFAQ